MYQKHVFICTYGPYCWFDADQGDTDAYLAYLKKKVAEAGLRDTIRINRSGCLNQCGHGPVVVVYPEGVWYGGVTFGDLDEIFQEHLLGDRPVERLRLILPPGNNKRTDHYLPDPKIYKEAEKALDGQRAAARADILRAQDPPQAPGDQ
jgi:(2Fe-2S) ferredoxin